MFINLHTHTDASNYRMLDAMNRLAPLFNYTNELGHKGIAITDHETVGAHVEAIHLMNDLKKNEPEKWKDYKLILGNEIYLCSRKKIQEEKEYVFPHFILLAKNLNGHKALRELSTRAWCENSFFWVNQRVPTFYDDLFEIMKEYKGDIVASTACAGGALPKMILAAWEKNHNDLDLSVAKKWIEKMVDVFGEGNFFLELQPSIQADQVVINQNLVKLSEELGVDCIITTDAHYLKKEDRTIHEAFLNSQDADREVADFYATTYIMSEKEIHEYLDETLGQSTVEKCINNTMKIYDMCEEYTLDKPLSIPYIPSNLNEPSEELFNKYKPFLPSAEYFFNSEHESDRHLIRDVMEKMANSPDEFENQEAYDAIEECLNTIKLTSEKQNTPWSGYFLQTKELIKICWESGSLVGPSRGSGLGFILLYMLDITQVNPLREKTKTYYWRFLNPERVSVPDIDVDVQGTLRETIVSNLQKRYGGYRHVTKVQTIMRAKAKNAIQIACRGLGLPPEDGVFLGSFIKAERGIQYTLSQTYYGDPENNIASNREFVNLMTNQYKEVWEVAQRIEGLCTGVGQHAGGCILCKEDMVDNVALMKTKSGDVITQYDLHASEACSLIKWDLLGVDCLEKMHIELDLLLEDGLIEWQGDLKSTYEKYIGVYNIERDNQEIWKLINQHKILSLFQFEKQSGWQAIELGQPKNLTEMAALNSVMRLMALEGGESPLERYARFRGNITEWYKEMTDYGLTEEEQKFVRKHAERTYGLLPNQEQFMQIVQAPEVGGYNLLWADKLRKSIAKKNPAEFNNLQEEFYKNIEEKHLSYKLCDYVWKVLISMNKGYGFNTSHTLGYSIVALQEANLAYHYPIIYWNTANLISDSGGMDGTVNYGKNAAAIGRMRKEGINIVPPYINEARFGFKPDAKNNEIVYGLKAVSGIGAATATAIVENQPYSSMFDFYNKLQEYKITHEECKFGDAAMIQLIKAGSFDKIEPDKNRIELMESFIKTLVSPIKKLQFSHLDDIVRLDLLPIKYKQKEYRYYRFRNYIFGNKNNIVRQDGKSPNTYFYSLDRKYSEPYFIENFEMDMTEGKDYYYTDDGYIAVKRGSFDKVFEQKMSNLKDEILSNESILAALNEDKINQVWEAKCGSRDIAKWEMESLNYYYTKHELTKVNKKRYNIVDFYSLSADSAIDSNYYIKGVLKPRYQLSRICGTVIDKDKNHSTVTLLTLTGVVVVRYYKGQFGFYDREISEIDADGKKKRIENSWFKRGTKLLITGFRGDEYFIPKTYKDSIYKHSTQLILDLKDNGELLLQADRIGSINEELQALGKV